MKDKLTAKKVLRPPSALPALLYSPANVVYWGWLADCGAMPIIRELFALFLYRRSERRSD